MEFRDQPVAPALDRQQVVGRHALAVHDALGHAAVDRLDLVAVDDVAILVIGLGRGQRAVFGVHVEDIVERFDTLAPNRDAGARQRFQRALEILRHRLVGIVEHHVLRRKHCERREFSAAHRRRHRATQRHVEQDAVLDRARQRPDRIVAASQRDDPCRVDAARARLEADDAVERRRNAHRAARIGADGAGHQPRGDRSAAARGRAARRAQRLAVVGVHRRAEMRVEAEARIGKFAHIDLADRDHAGRGGVGDAGEVPGLGRSAAEQLRAGGGRRARDVEQILPGDRHAVERRQRRANLVAALRLLCLGPRARRAHRDEDVVALGPGDPLQHAFGKLDGIRLARAVGESDACRCPVGDVFDVAHVSFPASLPTAARIAFRFHRFFALPSRRAPFGHCVGAEVGLHLTCRWPRPFGRAGLLQKTALHHAQPYGRARFVA